jgi:phenylacetyl-CoA:acceptor oxidoreductase subunit 2
MTHHRLRSGHRPRLQTFWDVRAACNFIGGGSGTGLIIVAAVAALAGAPWWTAALVGFACVAFGLGMVFLEIGRPWRAVNVFFHPQTSWMTRESVLAMPLFGLGAVALGSGLILGTDAGVAIAALLLAALIAAGFMYCQANILRAVRGVPAWREPALRPAMLATGLAEGGGLFLVVGALTELSTWSLWLALLAVAARGAAWGRYHRSLHRAGAPEASLRVVDRMAPWVLGLGHALPAVLLIVGLLAPYVISGTVLSVAAAVAGLLIAATGWAAKLLLMTRAAATRGFAVPHTPVRGRGTSRPSPAPPGWDH